MNCIASCIVTIILQPLKTFDRKQRVFYPPEIIPPLDNPVVDRNIMRVTGDFHGQQGGTARAAAAVCDEHVTAGSCCEAGIFARTDDGPCPAPVRGCRPGRDFFPPISQYFPKGEYCIPLCSIVFSLWYNFRNLSRFIYTNLPSFFNFKAYVFQIYFLDFHFVTWNKTQ